MLAVQPDGKVLHMTSKQRNTRHFLIIGRRSLQDMRQYPPAFGDIDMSLQKSSSAGRMSLPSGQQFTCRPAPVEPPKSTAKPLLERRMCCWCFFFRYQAQNVCHLADTRTKVFQNSCSMRVRTRGR